MRTIITTNYQDFKPDFRRDRGIFPVRLSLHFLGFGGSSVERVLENKAFSHARAAELGDFTPNMG
jgi:hypothetical protein